jgi:hypothetical protein
MDLNVFHLLNQLGFNDGMLFVMQQFQLDLKSGDSTKVAKPDFIIQDVLSFSKTLVFEDKSLIKPSGQPEPQLIAEAIAAYQHNRLQVTATYAQFQSTNEATVSDGGEKINLNIIYGISVKGLTFQFYEVPISQSILTSLETSRKALEITRVKRQGPLHFLHPEHRKIILFFLEKFKKITSELGIQSKRMFSR